MRPDDVIPARTDFSELDVQGLKDWLGHFEAFDVIPIDEKSFDAQSGFGSGSEKISEDGFKGE